MIAKARAADPSARHQVAADLRDELRAVDAGSSAIVPPPRVGAPITGAPITAVSVTVATDADADVDADSNGTARATGVGATSVLPVAGVSPVWRPRRSSRSADPHPRPDETEAAFPTGEG